MVDKPYQDKVWRHYRPGQCDDKQPSSEWFAAADRAIRVVREREERAFARDPRTGRVPLNAISVRQPWADLIASGVKNVENREWTPPPVAKGHLIAIHAGKTVDREAWSSAYQIVAKLGLLDVFPAIKGFGKALVRAETMKPRAAQAEIKAAMAASSYGAIVAVARIENVVKASDSPWFFGPFGWELGDVTPLRPISCTGAQYLWIVRDPALSEVRTSFAEHTRTQRKAVSA
jgi:hypothetical protein